MARRTLWCSSWLAPVERQLDHVVGPEVSTCVRRDGLGMLDYSSVANYDYDRFGRLRHASSFGSHVYLDYDG